MDKIIKVTNDKRPSKDIFIGINVSKSMAEYIRLFCLSQRIGKSKLIRSVLGTWKNSNIDKEEDLICTIVENLWKYWNDLPVYSLRWDSFLVRIEKELKDLRIHPKNITNIINELKKCKERKQI